MQQHVLGCSACGYVVFACDTLRDASVRRLTINTASSSPYSTTQLQQELTGFDFETVSAALETPTFSKPSSRGAGGLGSFRHRLTVEHEGGLSSYTGR